jgi:hypothetical protein
MTANKDSIEVSNFMALFAKVKDWSDDDPAGLLNLAQDDESVAKLCDRLFEAAIKLKKGERQARQLFASPTDPTFAAAWRDYEKRFHAVIAGIMFYELVGGLPETSGESPADVAWANADFDGEEWGRGIQSMINFADGLAIRRAWELSSDDYDSVRNGREAWDRLTADGGLDLRGVFRRRELVPFVLIPRQVGNKWGSTEKLSLLQNLQQAQEAFIFGAPFAALAMMRSVAEAVLHYHYGAEGEVLSKRINDAHSRRLLPKGVSAERLHRLRKLARAVLHLDSGDDESMRRLDDARLEKEIVSLLQLLRMLIEGAPQRRQAQAGQKFAAPGH